MSFILNQWYYVDRPIFCSGNIYLLRVSSTNLFKNISYKVLQTKYLTTGSKLFSMMFRTMKGIKQFNEI